MYFSRLPAAEQSSTEAAPKRGGTTGSEISEEVPIEALTELAGQFSSRRECTRLAAKLDFAATAVYRWQQSTQPIDMIAEEILLAWNAGVNCTTAAKRSVLEEALGDIRSELARLFKENCKMLAAKKRLV